MKLRSIFKKKKQKRKIKYKLSVTQIQDQLNITGIINKDNYNVKELWLISREKNIQYKVSEITPSQQFKFQVNLNKLLSLVIDHEEELFDWYFKVSRPYEDLSSDERERLEVELVKNESNLNAEYFIRCGRFQHTIIEGLTFHYQGKDHLLNYVTAKGNLSLTFNKEIQTPIKLQIDKIKKHQTKLLIEGKIFSKNSAIQKGEVVFRGRDSREIITSSNVEFHKLTEDTKKKYGLNRYTYVTEIDFSTINNGQLLEEDIYDLFFKLDMNDRYEAQFVRIGRPTLRARILLRELYATTDNEAMIINPYFTFKLSNLSFEIYRYPLESYYYLRKVMRWSWLLRLLNKNNDIWLVGERTYKAQDTGYAFFKHMRTKYPDKKVYYVIDKNSPESENVEGLGNVLDFKSKEHIRCSIIAKKVISSHHPDYLYPLRTDTFKGKVKADKVFLQHGVMGTKNMVANYGKNALGFDTDLFMVSSDFEKEMIVNDFGYSPKDVFVTGLSRFDTLFMEDVKKKRQILIIPTWRDWIVSDEALFESEYYHRYEQLINNPRLHELAKTFDFKIIFCLHPNMQKFSRYFQNSSVTVINQGEVDVQYLIKESSLMVTDYSSVGFDFSFLHKPVIYYQFDRSRFVGKSPSHLDLDNDLPGEICFEEEDILELIEKYAIRDFQMQDTYIQRANKFIKYRDLSSSERIYKVINENKASRNIIDNPKTYVIVKGLFTKFRRSKYYFPSMKLFYQLGSKIIKVDKNLILFESGLGKQYGDSPRNIYEEIIDRKLPYKKVWVYNRPHRFKDKNTKRINRLSPKYYYYLLKAGYWVNNQNFPTYIKKRPQTTYLQTWHGTPLKKMLFDIDTVHGRSDDYVERVGNAIKNWDYLISPSPYATAAFKSAFRYKGKMLEIGYPRNDIFYNDNRFEVAKAVAKKLKLENDKKVILYAPTFRDDQLNNKNRFSFDINMDLERMKERLGEEYVVLLRMHVVVSNKIVIEESLRDFVLNVSNYPDIQDLYLISDILMTDYSSVMFDFANTGRPILFFTYDLDNYRDNLRGFYMDFEKEAPGPLLYNTEQIIESIENIQRIQKDYQTKYEQFQQKYCSLEDGMASKRVVDKLFEK